MPNAVIDPTEILLGGVRFPILGGVRSTVVTPFPPKLTLGDYTRDDRVVESSWVLSSFNGGLGIQYGQLPKDADRYWFGDLETRYRHLMLGPEIVLLSEAGADALFLTDYNQLLYVITASQVLCLHMGDLMPVHTLSISPGSGLGTPTAVNQVNGELWVQCQNGILCYDGTTFTEYFDDGTGTPACNLPGVAAVVWDDKYFKMTEDGYLSYYIIGGSGARFPPAAVWSDSFTAAGRLHLPPGYCGQLMTYFDLSGELVIFAVTKIGLFGYAFDSFRFYPSALSFPFTASAGAGAIMWRGEVYDPAGSTIYKFNGTTVTNVSPARDDGLPHELQGDIVRLVQGHGFYFSVIQARTGHNSDGSAATDRVRSASPIPRDPTLGVAATQGAVIASPGVAWHTVYNESGGAFMGAAEVLTTADEGYRLWISTSNGLFYTDLTTELHNPLQNPTATFKERGSLESPWVDLGWAEIDKLALYLEVEARQCTPTETIGFEIAFDEGEYQPLGTVVHDGQTVFEIGGAAGTLFKSVRMRITMTRDPAQPNATPVLFSSNLAFIRRPDQVYGFDVSLQLAGFQHHQGKTPKQLVRHVHDLIASKAITTMYYHDEADATLREGRVVISRFSAAERGGDRKEGRYNVSMIELRAPHEFE